VAAVDAAGRALRAGDAAGALTALDRYEHDYPRGTLRPEATVLRIEALVARGDRARALILARRFLASHPTSAHRTRVRSLLRETDDSP
jgi:outer membrane protein assembly factor BamD (BamD/ComL family)